MPKTAEMGMQEDDAEKALDYERNAALVSRWRKRISKAKEHWAPVFKRMRDDQDWVYYGSRKDWWQDGGYVVNIMKRELRQSVVGLYARNPTAVATRRRKIDTVMWNGDMQQLRDAFDTVTQAQMGVVTDPQVLMRSAQLVQEVLAVRPELALRERFGKTFELLFEYFIAEQEPSFKRQMKNLVYRAKINTVGFLKLDFQRKYGERKAVGSELRDDGALLDEVEMRRAKDPHIGGEENEAKALETGFLEQSMQDRQVILQEGPVFDFPRSDKVIMDPNVVSIDGFLGANWIAVEMDMNREEIKRQWGFDIFEHWANERPYDTSADDTRTVSVWEVQDKITRTTFVICDGCDAFIREPAAPRVKIERFWTVFPLVLGFHEHYEHAYPLSDAHDMRDSQNEYNVSREALADHRRQNKPKYLAKKGTMQDENTKRALRSHASGEVIEIVISEPNQKLIDNFQAFQPYNIDPNQYNTSHVLDDFTLLGTKQEANLGMMSGATATESTIAENSRLSGQSAEVDDLDDFLSDVAKATGQLMMKELSQETVVKIVGPGAVWPELDDQMIADGVELTIRAGSAGRPNEAMTISKMERAMPFLIQIPGVNPEPLARKYAEALGIPVEEAIIEGLPSISSLNRQAGPQPGAGGGVAPPPVGGPDDQGPQGADNAPAGPETPSQQANVMPFVKDRA